MLRAKWPRVFAAILLLISLTVFNISPVYALTFGDISAHWAKDSVQRLASSEIVSGYNGNFNPNGLVTRAEFAAMIVKAMGLADQAQVVKGNLTGYNDVAPSHWASGFITVARETGVISGYPSGAFKPSAMIKRDEITSVLVRVLNLTSRNDMEDPLFKFGDGAEIPGWAMEAVKIAYSYKLVSGFPNGSFYPNRNATRGETAVLIEKVLEQFGAEFTFCGKVQTVNQDSRMLTLDINGQIETFSYRPGVEVRVKGVSAKINAIAESTVNIILDADGYITFIQTAEEAPDQAHTTAHPDEIKAASLSYAKRPANPINRQTVSSIIMTRKGLAGRITELLKSHGGKVKFINRDIDLICADISGELFGELKANKLIEEITADRRIKAEKLAVQDESETGTQSQTNPASSLNVNKEAMKAPEFVNLTHSDGKNQVIAIIDTGVDAGHPDLQKTSGNQRKIIGWRDFTGEGDIDTSSLADSTGKNLYLANGSYYLGDITSAGGRFRYGYIREVDLIDSNGDNGLDLNFNNNGNDIFAIILVSSTKQGSYDTVYIDTDGDKDFSDEKPLHLFARSPDYASFTGSKGRDRQNFVLTDIAPDGSKINLGFDANDHGTHIAGIAAANGKIKGVAPGAQIIAIKALDTAGYGNLSTITEAMTYAASQGAKIINLSFGFPVSDHDGSSMPAKLLNSLSDKYGVIFVVAAGNDGPGISTVATPGDASGALSVGAFNSPEMWKTDYGWDVPNENLWFFSSVGPRKDGAISPSIVAPGSAVSTVPLRDGEEYYLSEGTSMAAPHVSGAIALLLEVAQTKGVKAPPAMIKRAVEKGAWAIPGYQTAEQGYGALNLMMSWSELLSLQNVPRITVQTYNPDNEQGAGIIFREELPGKLTVYLKNSSNKLSKISLTGGTWLTPQQSIVNIPSAKTRAVDIDFNAPEKKGLSCSLLSGKDLASYGNDFEVLATVINPYILSEDNSYKIKLDDYETAAQYKRYFFKVPVGVGVLKANLSVPGGDGRSKLFLFNPKGDLVEETEFAGVNPAGTKGEVVISSASPSAGVWEVVVYTSAGLSAYQLDKSNYSLGISLEEVNPGEAKQENSEVIIGVVPKILGIGKKNYVTVQVRDRYTKRPFEGFIEINGRIYFSHRGRVTLPVEAGGDVNLVVRTVPESPTLNPWRIDFTMPSL